MAEAREFEEYVKAFLEVWGAEYTLGRDLEMLGHQSKNMLYDLEKFGGTIPRVTGTKPEAYQQDAWVVEQAVAELAKEAPQIAWSLRAMWCGRGRRGVERYELAKALCGCSFSKSEFYLRCQLGFAHVARFILRKAQRELAA
jgi:hypothetical protein